MSEPSQIYHTSGRPPLFYYQGYEIVGGSVSYDRTAALLTVGNLCLGENKGSCICELTGTLETLE